MLVAVAVFAAVIAVILFAAGRLKGRRSDRYVAALFLLPTAVLVLVGLLYPAARTIFESFRDAAGSSFVGFENYSTIFTDSEQLKVLRNTFLWVVLTPFVATAIGLLYAILIDRA